ncbi:MAG: hypothetical protein K1X53_11685 [Candidatus Sumerlaeaceae bacterium]|nr:hypothetical protein [Candidatus Sumerlaeaceae bacterium]
MTEFAQDNRFATTRWSIVLRAGTRDENARTALETLCECYWQPLYFFLRRKGYTPEDAIDLVQGFIVTLLEKGQLGSLDQSRGRFRSYLMAALMHYLSNERDRARAGKRGGNTATVSLDAMEAEQKYQLVAQDSKTPEDIFAKQWALGLLNRVLAEVGRSYDSPDQRPVFEALKPTITGELNETYAELAATLDMTETAVKVAAHRLRRRYREAFRATILDTLDSETTLEDEVNYLLKALTD